MSYTSKQLEELINGSKSTKARNAHLGSVSNQKPQQETGATLECGQKRERQRSNGPRYRVSIVTLRAKIMDDDNFRGGTKPLRDALAAHYALDDSERNFEWEYHQIISKTQGTLVLIEEL